MDTSKIPLGELAWKNILAHVVEHGDASETNYLEVKSDLNLGSALGIAKVAKFLLGSANRLPSHAAKFFQGYSVMVIGAEKGQALGTVKGVEPHDVEATLRKYLGSDFPHFDFGRISVSQTHEVILVIASPPENGQPIFVCHKDFQGESKQDNLTDGAIYVRDGSSTRPAKSGEIKALLHRSTTSNRPALNLTIEATPINRVEDIKVLVNDTYQFEEEEFLESQRKRKEPVVGFPQLSFATTMALVGYRPPEKQYADWKTDLPDHKVETERALLEIAFPAFRVQITANGRYVSKPHLRVTFFNCSMFDRYDLEYPSYGSLFEPILQEPTGIMQDFPVIQANSNYRPNEEEWSQIDNDVVVTFTPDSLRPDQPFASADDITLIANNPNAETIQVRWTLTEDKNDQAVTDEFELATGALMSRDTLLRLIGNPADYVYTPAEATNDQ
ncbi:hypothetical protein [Lysinibacter cavernae]|uniref:hypothetical protein n=1 Tax=Lysinibacter cavernae TaxID=1640652 RepID=UPI0036245245